MPGLEDLYREIILDHYRNPRNKGELATPPAHRTEGMNPLCGDEISVYLVVDGHGPDATVTDISIGGQGCSISQSSASMMTTAVKGKTVAEARLVVKAFKSMMGIHDVGADPNDGDAPDSDAPDTDAPDTHDHDDTGDGTNEVSPVKLGDLEALRGVVKFPVRIKCATLAWNTMNQGLDEVSTP
jgi:nitrogen fixation protein NifU and related proteins